MIHLLRRFILTRFDINISRRKYHPQWPWIEFYFHCINRSLILFIRQWTHQPVRIQFFSGVHLYLKRDFLKISIPFFYSVSCLEEFQFNEKINSNRKMICKGLKWICFIFTWWNDEPTHRQHETAMRSVFQLKFEEKSNFHLNNSFQQFLTELQLNATSERNSSLKYSKWSQLHATCKCRTRNITFELFIDHQQITNYFAQWQNDSLEKCVRLEQRFSQRLKKDKLKSISNSDSCRHVEMRI